MHEPVGRQCATKWANCLPYPGSLGAEGVCVEPQAEQSLS